MPRAPPFVVYGLTQHNDGLDIKLNKGYREIA